MLRTTLRSPLCAVAFLIMVLPTVLFLHGSGATPAFSNFATTPDDPTILDRYNISLVLSDPMDTVVIQDCGPGEFGMCRLNDMVKAGNDTSFFIEYESGYFQVGRYHFSINITYPGDVYLTKEFYEDFAPVATSIVLIDLDPAPGTPIGRFPEGTVRVTGQVQDDLGKSISGAWANLSIEGTSTFKNTTTGPDGSFISSVSVPDSGDLTLVLNVTDPVTGLSTEATWPLTVNEWPLPAVTLSAEFSFDEASAPPGTMDTFYNGSDLDLTYSFMNSGTGDALNLTVRIFRSGEVEVLWVGNLTAGGYLNGSAPLITAPSGEHYVVLNCTYDQEAPEDLKGEEPSVLLSYSVVDPPTWDEHRALVEMFTQTTCVPCVNVEEAVEGYSGSETSAFEFVMYVMDDDASASVGTQRGVTGTPVVFVDGNFETFEGGGDVDAVTERLNRSVHNATGRITPPLGIALAPKNGNYTASVILSSEYSGDPVTGRLVILSLESYSNVRNEQGIPVRNRYIGRSADSGPITLGPAPFVMERISLNSSATDLLAIFYDDAGSVLQVKRTNVERDPKVYLRSETPLLRISGSGNASFDITVETFHRGSAQANPGPFTVSIRSSVPDLTVKDQDGIDLVTVPRSVAFTPDGSETLSCGRTRTFDSPTLVAYLANDTTRTISFDVIVQAGKRVFTNSVAVIQTRIGPQAEVRIESNYLSGEGGSIYFTARVLGLPTGAKVIGTVVPTTGNGSAGRHGSPVTVELASIGNDTFRGPVTGIDLTSYDHLSYSVHIEKDGVVLNRSSERTVPISDLIVIVNGNGGDGDDIAIFIIIAVIAALLFLVILVITVVMIRRGRTTVVVPDQSITEGPMEKDDAVPEGLPQEEPPTASTDPIQKGPDPSEGALPPDVSPAGDGVVPPEASEADQSSSM